MQMPIKDNCVWICLLIDTFGDHNGNDSKISSKEKDDSYYKKKRIHASELYKRKESQRNIAVMLKPCPQ
jgi:hypothetical protein